MREFIRDTLGDHACTEISVLLASELVTNSVLHSDSRRPGNTVTVTVTGMTDGIRVDVLDAGGASVPCLARADAEVTEHGHGLCLVSDLAPPGGATTATTPGSSPGSRSGRNQMHMDSYGLTPVDDQAHPAGPGGRQMRSMAWPVRSGLVPPLAEGFIARTETVPGLEAALVPGAAVALVTGHEAAGVRGTGPGHAARLSSRRIWPGLCGGHARWTCWPGWPRRAGHRCCPATYRPPRGWGWITASDAEAVAARLVAWLGGTAAVAGGAG